MNMREKLVAIDELRNRILEIQKFHFSDNDYFQCVDNLVVWIENNPVFEDALEEIKLLEIQGNIEAKDSLKKIMMVLKPRFILLKHLLKDEAIKEAMFEANKKIKAQGFDDIKHDLTWFINYCILWEDESDVCAAEELINDSFLLLSHTKYSSLLSEYYDYKKKLFRNDISDLTALYRSHHSNHIFERIFFENWGAWYMLKTACLAISSDFRDGLSYVFYKGNGVSKTSSLKNKYLRQLVLDNLNRISVFLYDWIRGNYKLADRSYLLSSGIWPTDIRFEDEKLILSDFAQLDFCSQRSSNQGSALEKKEGSTILLVKLVVAGKLLGSSYKEIKKATNLAPKQISAIKTMLNHRLQTAMSKKNYFIRFVSFGVKGEKRLKLLISPSINF